MSAVSLKGFAVIQLIRLEGGSVDDHGVESEAKEPLWEIGEPKQVSPHGSHGLASPSLTVLPEIIRGQVDHLGLLGRTLTYHARCIMTRTRTAIISRSTVPEYRMVSYGRNLHFEHSQLCACPSSLTRIAHTWTVSGTNLIYKVPP